MPPPLAGYRVLVTRPGAQAADFERRLRSLGADVVIIPTVEIRPLPAREEALEAIRHLPQTKLVVFTSANGVDVFVAMLLAAGQDVRALLVPAVCAIGPETAARLRAQGIEPRLVAEEYTAEGLAHALEDWQLAGARVLIPRASQARDLLPRLLQRRGAEVVVLPIYEAAPPPGAAGALTALFATGGVDLVTFTSSSTVANFAAALGPEGLAKVRPAGVACIGPVTADTARKLGLRVDIVARDYTTRGLADAIVEALASKEKPWRNG
jgi:uroporphyrinogen III methyltransferase/synthase